MLMTNAQLLFPSLKNSCLLKKHPSKNENTNCYGQPRVRNSNQADTR